MAKSRFKFTLLYVSCALLLCFHSSYCLSWNWGTQQCFTWVFECNQRMKNIYLCLSKCNEVQLYSLFWQICFCRSQCCITLWATSVCLLCICPLRVQKSFDPHKLGTQDYSRTLLHMSLFSNTVMITIQPMRKCSSFSGCKTLSLSPFLKNEAVTLWFTFVQTSLG